MSGGQDWANEENSAQRREDIRRRIAVINRRLEETTGKEHSDLYLEREALVDELEP